MLNILEINNSVLQDKLYVWKTKVYHHIKEIDYYWLLLNEEEKKRADEYYFTNDKNRYVISRGILRVLLSLYTKRCPQKIEFSYTKYGKPCISSITNDYNISFNLAHSKDAVVYGFTKNVPIGIDVEYFNTDMSLNDIELIVNYACSNGEKIWLQNLSDAHKRDYFYKLWVIKEAFIKFIGLGFSFDLRQISINFNENKSITIVDKVNKDKYNLTIEIFKSYNGYYSAFVTTKAVSEVIYYDYQNKVLGLV